MDDDDALPPGAAEDEEGLDGDSRVAIYLYIQVSIIVVSFG